MSNGDTASHKTKFQAFLDEEIICSSAGQFGFRAYQLNAQDDNWGEKIIEQADHIRKLEHFD